MLVSSANPEDYTNRGRIITPLKDRFGAQIRTHYPLDVETESTSSTRRRPRRRAGGSGGRTRLHGRDRRPTISQLARQSPHINQRSGVSVRLRVANYETLVANAARRALRLGESEAVPRISDLDALASSTSGKVEIETLDEGRDEQVVDRLVKAAVLSVFKDRCPMEQIATSWMPSRTAAWSTPETTSRRRPTSTWSQMPDLRKQVVALAGGESPAEVASAVEFVLEGLHLSKRLNKEAAGTRATYRSRGSAH